MMTQKGDPYIIVFSTLSEVSVVLRFVTVKYSLHGLVKPYYSKNDDSPVIHRSCYGHCTCYPTCWISSKRSVPYIKTFSILSGVRPVFWVLPQLDILCTSAVQRYYAKNDNSPFNYHLFSRVLEFMAARKTCHRVARTTAWLISYSGELCNKNCIVKTSETLIIWSASGGVLLHCWVR